MTKTVTKTVTKNTGREAHLSPHDRGVIIMWMAFWYLLTIAVVRYLKAHY